MENPLNEHICTMKKNLILLYGLIAGVIVSALMLTSVTYFSHCEGSVDFGTSMALGYASMLLAFSMVFVGIRNYRNNQNNGIISFGKAFKIGILIVLVASTIYVAAWLVDYYVFIPDFAERYAAQALAELKASGASQQEIQRQAAEMADFGKLLNNPLLNGMMTYLEILPVGLIVTLISALVLRRKTAKESAS